MMMIRAFQGCSTGLKRLIIPQTRSFGSSSISNAKEERFLVTGGQGFIGAWAVKQLLQENAIGANNKITVFDMKKDDNILGQVLSPNQLSLLDRRFGDVSDTELVNQLVGAIKPSTVLHLAGLQVPTCKVNPLLGAKVNILGTLNIFESVKNLRDKHKQSANIVYASSAAITGNPVDYKGIVMDESAHRPLTHYGVFKLANEGNARVYWHDHKIPSVGLRPFTVYGVGREIGLTSAPTKAIKSAVLGRDYVIPFGGKVCLNYVEDIAKIFINCGRANVEGAYALNIKGDVLSVEEFVRILGDILPSSKGHTTFKGDPLPFPVDFSESGLKNLLKENYFTTTPVAEGVKRTAQIFTELKDRGALYDGDFASPMT